MGLKAITDQLLLDLAGLEFSLPVTHVMNPLHYARKPYDLYLERYGRGPAEVIFLGMNPGPWGMVQTGVPFGEVTAVRDFLGIEASVETPAIQHPKRPVHGFACRRSEVSGRRLWGWAAQTFGTPQGFFERYFVANYCPLAFMEESGKNRTPDKLPKSERDPLFAACNHALRSTVLRLGARLVVGVGGFAEARAKEALTSVEGVQVGRILHPSPANPAANRGWEQAVNKDLQRLGIRG